MSDRNNDFSLLVKLLNGFLKKDEIKKRLYSFVEKETNDWEKWLQIEFAHYLTSKKKYELHREVTIYLDPIDYPDSRLAKVDLILREKSSPSDDYIFIEFKCTKRVVPLVRGLAADQKKISAIRQCNYKMRNYLGVGFHLFCEPDDIEFMEKYVTEQLKGSYAVFKLCECPVRYNCQCEFNEIGVVLF